MSTLTDDSNILQIQRTLHHVIQKNKGGKKPKKYAMYLLNHFKFFNDLKEEMLIRNNIHDSFKIGHIFLKELKWVFSDEDASLVYDALCGTNDDYKVDLEKNERVQNEEEDTCGRLYNDINTSVHGQQLPISKEPTLNLFDEETQIDMSEVPDEISNNCRNRQSKSIPLVETQRPQNPKLNEKTGDITLNQLSTYDDIQLFDVSRQWNVNEKADEKYVTDEQRNVTDFGLNENVPQNLDSTLFEEDTINCKIGASGKATDQILKDRKKYFHARKQEETPDDTNKNLQESHMVLDESVEMDMNIDSASKVLEFYPQDTKTTRDSQLGMLMLQQTESNFSDHFDWDTLREVTEKKVDDCSVFFEKFLRVANQFNSAMNSKMFPKAFDSIDQFIIKTSLLSIKYTTATDPYFTGLSSNENIPDPDFQWACENEQKIKREKTLVNLLRTIFKYLYEILKDFSKLHSATFNWHEFLVRKLFNDIKQYFDERYSTSNDNYITNDGLNICCEFIKTAVNEILASDELAQFLQWEEQCFILGELCNSNVVCRKTLEFLLDRTVAVLENLEKQTKNAKSFQDPSTVEKLYIIFPMIENLVKKYVTPSPASKVDKKEENKRKQEASLSQLWRSHAFCDGKHYDFNNLQDSEEEAIHAYQDKWIQDIEKIIKLTNARLCYFSFKAQGILRVLKEFNGGDKVKFSFSQSQ